MIVPMIVLPILGLAILAIAWLAGRKDPCIAYIAIKTAIAATIAILVIITAYALWARCGIT